MWFKKKKKYPENAKYQLDDFVNFRYRGELYFGYIYEAMEVDGKIEYTIQKKETIFRLCRKFDISSSELIRLNPELKKGVKAGMIIKIPVKTQETITTQPISSSLSEREVNDLLSTHKSIEYVNQIKVALFFPFMTNEVNPSAETLRFIEYYEGFLLAVDSLRNMGCSIELSVYDTGKGTKKLKYLEIT